VSAIRPREFSLKNGEAALIRGALPKDASILVEIKRSVVKEGEFMLAEHDEFKSTEGKERAAIREHSEGPGHIYLVAEVDGDVVGLLHFENGRYRRTRHSGMLAMYVQKEWRGRGVGTALLQTLMDWATHNPLIEKVTLAVFSTNPRAISLYRKLGFEVEGRCPRDMKLADGQYIDSVLMYKFVK
jgi:RimJ/RimL family protein N-acetyltransferase